MAASVRFRTITNTSRACAVEVETSNGTMTLINTYMPVDTQRKSTVSDEFLETMDNIETFIHSCGSNRIVVAGDLNVDFVRGNAHDKYMKDFMGRWNLVDSFDLAVANKGYTYHDFSNGGKSCIDHFLVHHSLCDSVMKVSRCEHALNPSKHLPVIMEIFEDKNTIDVNDNGVTRMVPPISWNRVNDGHIQEYQEKQREYLVDLPEYDMLDCDNVQCENTNHKREIDELCAHLIDCCLAADHVFPRVSKITSRPEWTVDVKPYRDEAIIWYNLWIQTGRPSDGIVFENMRESKRQYAYANRRNKRQAKQKRLEKMAVAISNNESRNFFREIKKLHPRNTTAPMIDNCIDPGDIAKVFSAKYEDLYNSVPSDTNTMKNIKSQISRNIHHCSTGNDFAISPAEIDKAIKKLKKQKSDGDKGLLSDHIILSGVDFRYLLGKLITSVIIHGHTPDAILLGTIASIPKDSRGNLLSSTNYRGITLCNAISKIMDIILIYRYHHILSTSDMQYAFKPKHSTVLCSLTLKEVINYYLNNNSNVYACFVDASKAFDKVRHDMLFEVLLQRGMPEVILRFMLDMYARQNLRTVWKGKYSDSFTTSNGIRQGGVISPLLFCVYVDVLLLDLEKAGVGCRIGKHFYGAQCYADDITLCAPTLDGLRRMLKICEKFGETYSVTYNPSKTVCVLFSRRQIAEKPVVYMKGIQLEWKDEVKHLGNCLTYNLRECAEIRMKKSDLIQRVNSVCVTLGKSSVDIVSKVFNAQCAHFYGSEAWRYSDKSTGEFQTMWNRCVRRLLHLPYTTHRHLLPQLMDCPSAIRQIYSRFLKLLDKMKESDNERVAFLAKMCINDQRSIIGSNLTVICNEISCDIGLVLEKGQTLLKQINRMDCDIVSLIKDICDNRVGMSFIHGFYSGELDFILQVVCTT